MLCNRFEKIALSTNVRMYSLQDPSAQTFLDIGNGETRIDRSTNEISFPPNVSQILPIIQAVIDMVFSNLTTNYENPDWLFERAIVAPMMMI